MKNDDLLKRAKGSLLGLACGDAVGTTLEFQKTNNRKVIKDMVGGGPFNLLRGQWTDDTSMALCLAGSLLEKLDFDPWDQMDRYCRWKNEGYMSSTGVCFDIGNTVKEALIKYEKTGNPFSGSTDPLTAGNGCIMRLAPLVMFFFPNLAKILRLAADSSRTTHGCLECIESTQLLAYQIYSCLEGKQKNDIIFQTGMKFSTSNVASIARGEYLYKRKSQLPGSGYVIETMESALWCFAKTKSFQEAILLAANLSEDADSVAAVCGQIAGAYYGLDNIPSNWLRNLHMRNEIEEIALKLIERGS